MKLAEKHNILLKLFIPRIGTYHIRLIETNKHWKQAQETNT